MFGARKKFVEFVEVVDNDFPDESMYYNQPSMFPHRSDKDVSVPPPLCGEHHTKEDSSGVLTVLKFLSRSFHLPRRRRQVSCRSLVQVCMLHKVSFGLLQLGRSFVRHHATKNGLSLSAGALGFSVRGMGNNTPQLNRNLTQGTQLPSHITPTTGVPTMSLHTPPSPSRYGENADFAAYSVFMRTSFLMPHLVGTGGRCR